MKKLLLILSVLFIFQAEVFAASSDVDLREYQQSAGTVNVLAAPFENANFHLATFNFDKQVLGSNVDFYQGVCLVDQKDNKTLHPLTVKKITGNEQQFSETVLDKNGNKPYKQDFRKVQTTSNDPLIYTGGDATNIVFLGKFKVVTEDKSFDDCIGIKIYNQKTNEAMIQYLAKGQGVVYMEGVRADGSKVEIARLSEVRPLTQQDIQDFKNGYFNGMSKKSPTSIGGAMNC